MTGKKALIIRGGTMKGAFVVGVLRVFYEKLGVNYFDAIYSNSVGVFEQVFFAADQPDTMENTWREYVHGKQLINFFNIFKRRPILDLDYLIELFQSEKSMLNVEKMRSSKPNLFCVVSNCDTKEAEIVDLKTGDVFQTMLATSALPILYHKKIHIDGKRYHDGTMTIDKIFNQLIEQLLEDGFSEVIVMLNHKKSFRYNDPRVRIIEPSTMPLWSGIDTNRDRIIKTIEQGKKDALHFLEIKQ